MQVDVRRFQTYSNLDTGRKRKVITNQYKNIIL